MIRVERIFIQDIANAPFIDRLFYTMFNSGVAYTKTPYLTLNPLKWCLLTVFHLIGLLLFAFIFIPFILIPFMTVDAITMKRKYAAKSYKGWWLNDVLLLRDIS